VIDDYGHHPTEIRATLQALRDYYRPKRLICVFQPHQHSRTFALLGDFIKSFSEADHVIIPGIYSVREADEQRASVSASDLVEGIQSQGVAAEHLIRFDLVVRRLGELARAGDLVVTMGAGDVYKIAHKFLNQDVAIV
jgi:UDP-N-acetylmuramate--alanine ligase